MRAFSDCAWQCFLARDIEIPTRTTFVFATWFGGVRHGAKQEQPEPFNSKDFKRAKKALSQFDRDSAFCWDKLTDAIDDGVLGTRAAIRALNSRTKWRAEYDSRMNWVETHCKRDNIKTTGKQSKILEFAKRHGAVYLVAGSSRMFATAEEAQAFMRTTKDTLDFAERTVNSHSAENVRLCKLFDEGRWDELAAGLDAADKKDNDENRLRETE